MDPVFRQRRRRSDFPLRSASTGAQGFCELEVLNVGDIELTLSARALLSGSPVAVQGISPHGRMSALLVLLGLLAVLLSLTGIVLSIGNWQHGQPWTAFDVVLLACRWSSVVLGFSVGLW